MHRGAWATPRLAPVRRSGYLSPGMLRQLRAAANIILHGHPDPTSLVMDAARAATDKHAARLTAVEQDLDTLRSRVQELYVDASIISRLEDAYDRRHQDDA
jgi:hypothetical protein